MHGGGADRTVVPMELFGIHLLGVNGATFSKLALTVAVVLVGLAIRRALYFVPALRRGHSKKSIWVVKGFRLAIGALAALIVASVWFDNPGRLATFTGLVAAGAAVASQNAILSMVGYFVIVFGKVFDIGDRIDIGDVRGDVLDIGLFKTTIMEMGVPSKMVPDPNHWIRARQYTGRVVTFTNSEVFSKPTYNYSREFDFMWEEIQLPLKYDVDLELAEKLALDAARELTKDIVAEGRKDIERLEKRFFLHTGDLEPQGYVRLTDNWVELTVRFLVKTFGIRQTKDQISRRLLKDFRAHGIEIASATYEIVGLPRVKLNVDARGASPDREDADHGPAGHDA